MWSAEVGGRVHSKNRLVSSRQHRATEVRKLRFLCSCQYTHGCCAPASWAARHTTVCLDILPLDIYGSAAFANGKVWVDLDNPAHDASSHNCKHDRIIMLKLQNFEI